LHQNSSPAKIIVMTGHPMDAQIDELRARCDKLVGKTAHSGAVGQVICQALK
jgi:hypothetical protein